MAIKPLSAHDIFAVRLFVIGTVGLKKRKKLFVEPREENKNKQDQEKVIAIIVCREQYYQTN
jgi:hypothetical protein